MQNPTLTSPVYNYLRQYEWLRRFYRESRALYNIARNRARAVLKGQISGAGARSYCQSIPKHRIALDGFNSAEQLCSMLNDRGIRYATGRHAVYLPPQQRLSEILGEAVKFYPPDTGFKILKDFRSPEQARYIIDGNIRRVTETMMGSVTNQVLAANGLFAFGIGPPCYGVVHLRAGDQDLTAFVVRHIEGRVATAEECLEFADRLRQLVDEGLFDVVPNRQLADPDFLPPHCNGNLLRDESTGKLCYVDFQQLLSRQQAMLRSLATQAAEVFHFGGSSTVVRKGQRYLYQSIPGLSAGAKRDTSYRWQRIKSLLNRNGMSLENRVVLDVCCNSGMMLSNAIGDGAIWGVGFDLPPVVAQAERIMAVLGASRVSMIPAKLSPNFPLASTIPAWLSEHLDQSVVFYLAAVQHVGLIADLSNIPWKALVYEGHQGESPDQVEDNLSSIQANWKCSLAYRETISDGDCGKRTFALFTR